MSIRINLLPEARLHSIKNKQVRRLTTIISLVIVSSVGMVIIILLLLLGARNIQFATNSNDINEIKTKLQAKKNDEQDIAWINKALEEGDKLNDNRIIISQLFDYLDKAIPEGVTLIDVSVDKDYKVKSQVKAQDYNNVALFLKALETYNVNYGFIDGFERRQVFTEVDAASVTKKGPGTADFEITFKVDPELVKKFRADNPKDDNETASTPSPSSSPSPQSTGGTQ